MSSDETFFESTTLTGEHPHYDPVTGSYHVTCNFEHTDSILISLVEAISDVTDTRQDRMEPLHSVLDSDALGTLLSNDTSDVRVSFSYEGCDVTASSDGSIVVVPEDERR